MSARNMTERVFCFIVTVLVVLLLVSLLAALEEGPKAEQATFYQQCQIWNKWAHWPKHGSCPGDYQVKVWR